ncbi:HdeA/HdeB family chaperone [Xinfangfangia pollutisoli]|uniref:HdeA/HdeB family chaperone n=1 Tax=Xinfangfangia pollutisoli TaxID=2865960 RepID=UPI001CD3D12B|nr:HdeA/HdeB family chaperone [Xinfangfangia pollutisoli]
MTLKALLALALATPLFAGMAAAEAVDVNTITCADLATIDAEGVTALMFWVDGYLGGVAGDTNFDLERLKANIDGAAALCTSSPDASLIDLISAAEEANTN